MKWGKFCEEKKLRDICFLKKSHEITLPEVYQQGARFMCELMQPKTPGVVNPPLNLCESTARSICHKKKCRRPTHAEIMRELPIV